MGKAHIQTPDVISDPRLGRLTPFPWFDGKLYAAYLLGSDWDPAGTRDGLHDWSGNERDLTKTGADGAAGEQAYHYIADQTHFLDAPFTGDAFAGVSGSGTILALHKLADGVNGALVTNGPPVAGGETMSLLGTASQAAQAQAQNDGSTFTAGLSNDADRGDVWEVICGVYTASRVTIYRYVDAAARPTFTNLAVTLSAVGGDKTLRIGNNKSASLTASVPVAAVAFYTGTLKWGEITEAARALLSLADEYELP